MIDYQARVIDEKDQLDSKITLLINSTDGEVFLSLHDKDKALMRNQLSAMRLYSAALSGRISRFCKE